MMADTFEQWTTKTARFFGHTTGRAVEILERTTVAVWLVFLYSLAIFLALATSTAFHLQSQIAESTSEEQILKAMKAQQNLNDLEYQRRNLQWEIEDIEYKKSVIFVDTISNGDRFDTKNLVSAHTDLNNQKKSNDVRIVALSDRIKTIRQDPIFSAENGSVRELANDLIFLGEIDPSFTMFALMPIHLLTLLLTISMGALGSVIHLTWEFFELERKNFSYYVFRPFLGAILAFSIYILLKSGQMVLISAEGSSGENLNPYFISLLAIVSGMLSKQAYERISDAGNRLLRPPVADTKRWIRSSVALQATTERGRSMTGFANHANVSEAHVDGWLTGAEALSQRDQDLLSAWLDVPARDLFSELPPPSAKAPTQEQAGQRADHAGAAAAATGG